MPFPSSESTFRRREASFNPGSNKRDLEELIASPLSSSVSKQRPSSWGLLEYYRRLAETRKPASSTMVRLKSPTQTSTLYTMDGRNILVGPDGTFELSLEDAKPLLMAGWQRLPDAMCY